MKKKVGIWAMIVGVVAAVGHFFIPIIQDIIAYKIQDIDFKEEFLNKGDFINDIMWYKIPIWSVILIIVLFILVQIIIYNIKKYNEKNKLKDAIKVDDLTLNEKEVLKKFYIPELKKYTKEKREIYCRNNAIELLTERGIIKKQTEMELIDNYIGNGVLYQLTDEAVKELNKK